MNEERDASRADRLLTLSAERRELLQRLLRDRAGARIGRRPFGQMVVPASSGQRRLWFLNELEPGSPVYQISQARRIDGELEPGVLECALQEVVRRHEALRTTFALVDGEPVQVVQPESRFAWLDVDLSCLPEHERDARARQITTAEARQPFDLTEGPLLRAMLVRFGPARHLLMLTLHHIVADGWSMEVVMRELDELAEALAAGNPSPLPELPIQYPDYALWQRQQLTPQQRAADLAYWTAQLAGLAPLALPLDRLRPAAPTWRGAREFFRIPNADLRGLEQLARDGNATLFMALLAVFKVLLARCSAQDDIAVGSPVAGRGPPETEALVGFFLNTLCLRTRLDGDPTFLEVLERVRGTALGAYAHQELPFDVLVEALAPARRFMHSALFDVMFVLQAGRQRRDAACDEVNDDPGEWELESGTSKCDLTLSILERPDGLVGALEYATDLFSAQTARRLVRRYTQLLRQVTSAPRQAISRLDLLLDGERTKLLEEWNATAMPWPSEVCIPARVAEHAGRAPDSPAVVCGRDSLSYGELDAQANRLAHHLIASGVGCEDRVAVLMERTPDLLVAVFAIWKAGAVYVPLDLDAPPARNAAIAATAEVRATLGPALPHEAMRRHEPTAPAVELRPSQLAYILYTSGSTGLPKGVMVEHASLLNYLTWVNRELAGARPLPMPATTKPSFDASLKQLFAPLLEGRWVWLVPEAVVADPEALLAGLPRHGDFALNCVPWLWKLLLERLESGAHPVSRHLKRLLVGGEELTRGLVERTFAHLPELELWNLYGPTEATANATAARLAPNGPVSIGRPIGNATAFILDGHGGLAPIGVPGELHIGGVGVARGYWRQPELTAERFVTNPFGQGRLYRTGDLARWAGDGSIEFIGRRDSQVKMHGFRIELGEIEGALERHPAVRQAALAVRREEPSDRLVACIELHAGGTAAATDLRQFLRATLPDYMVPVRFEFVDALPRGPHGKLDRQKLAELASRADRPESGRPLTADEERVARIWRAVLGVDVVRAESNFFELGGHSLLLAQVVSRLREAFSVEIPLRALFDAPTLEGCANTVARAAKTPGTTPPTIRRLDRKSGAHIGERPATGAITREVE
ncbi:MAG: non-ribosomal peptide synthetase [Rhizobacter sp.]